ncbi:MAG: hypothetical protein ACYC2H_02060 [Thermoplasmatota archaeon]
MQKISLKMKDVERLENTSMATALLGAPAADGQCTYMCTGVVACETWFCSTQVDPSTIYIGVPATAILPTTAL